MKCPLGLTVSVREEGGKGGGGGEEGREERGREGGKREGGREHSVGGTCVSGY